MIKAVFMDLYGTLVKEIGPAAQMVIRQVYDSGEVDTMEEIGAAWFEEFARKTAGLAPEDFRTQYDISLEIFEELLPRFRSPLDAKTLNDQMVVNWSNPPAYDGAAEFLASVSNSKPVYLVTNSDDFFARPALEQADLHPAGIFTSEQARSFKPQPEIFEYALQQTGLKPEEVIHLGDSLTSDVYCPAKVGIRGIWLNREGRPVPEGVTAVGNFDELRAELERSFR